MRKPGPRPDQLRAFLNQVQADKRCPQENAYKLLADTAGMSEKNVRRYFADPTTNSYKGCPFAVWSLWNLRILGIVVV